MAPLFFLAGFLAILAAFAAVFFLSVPVAVVATWGMGVLCLVWLVVLITLPWNVYFKAREVLADMATAKERGLTVSPDRWKEATQLRKRALITSLLLHALSAACIGVVAWWTGSMWAAGFSAFYLVSCLFRPGFEMHRYIQARLRQLTEDVRFPRDDVVRLQAEVARVASELKALQDTVEQHRVDAGTLATRVEQQAQASVQRDMALDVKVVAISRKFEDTVNKLSDNKELISGIKAFLRLIHGEQHTSSP